jgi:SAM-dependent methyltransferase
MRATSHISVAAAPDYALRVPSHLQLLRSVGLLGGILGLGLLLSGAPVPGSLLVALGLTAGGFAVAISSITSLRLRERARRQMLDAIAWRGDEQVLDVGCGNGFLLIEAAKQLPGGRAVGIDLWKANTGDQSPEIAWRNAQLEGVADRVEIRNADARNVPFADGTFDVIASSLMLHHAGGRDDRERVLAEMARVLKPGGTLLLYDVAPLIGSAAETLRRHGLGQVERTGRVMAVLSARRS